MHEDAQVHLEEIIKLEQGKELPIMTLSREGEPTEEVLKVVSERRRISLSHATMRNRILSIFFLRQGNEELIRQMPRSITLKRTYNGGPLVGPFLSDNTAFFRQQNKKTIEKRVADENVALSITGSL